MQTTLRINDQLYQRAKTEAARTGVTLTKFLEESIRLRLDNEATSTSSKWKLRVSEGKGKYPSSAKMNKILDDIQLEDDLRKLG